MTSRRNDFAEALTAVLRDAGATDISTEYGGKHPRLIYRLNGVERYRPFPGTPSDSVNGIAKAVAELKRELGLNSSVKRVGERRRRRTAVSAGRDGAGSLAADRAARLACAPLSPSRRPASPGRAPPSSLAGVLAVVHAQRRRGEPAVTEPRQMTMLFGEAFDLPPGGLRGAALGAGDPLPPGPFTLSMLYDMGLGSYALPYCVVGADGKTVAGHIPSLEIAKAVRDALNQAYPT